MIDGTGFVDSEKKKNKKRKESIAQLRLKGSPLHVQTQPYLRPFVVELTKTDKKKYQTLPSDYFWDLCCHISSLSHSWFPVMKFSLCLFFFFCLIFWRVNIIYWPISDFHIFFFVHWTVLPQVVIWCDSIHWRHCAKSRSHHTALLQFVGLLCEEEILP